MVPSDITKKIPDSKVHGTNMGPIWGRQSPGGPHVGPMNFAIWVSLFHSIKHINPFHVPSLFTSREYKY